MEPAKGFKGILLDVLGLKPDGASPPVADSADAAAPSAGDLLPQHEAAEPDDVAEKPARAHIDEHDELFAARLLDISQRFASDASAARDAQQSLQQAHQQAKSKEREVLAAADAAYTPAWCQTGIPSKPSQLQLDESLVSGCRLLDPAAIITRQCAHQQKEVLQPPAVFAYCDKAADPHFLQTTGNQKVREKISATRIAAVRTAKQRQHQDHAPCSTAQSQQEQQEQHFPQPQQVPPALQGQAPPLQQQQQQRQQQQQQQSSSASGDRLKMDPPNGQQLTAVQQRGSPSRARAKPVSSVPWSQLPAEDAASKVAAAAARYKAMAAIMTPEQRQLEEKIIKSMYQRLSYLRNPRYAEQPRATPPGSAGLKGASTAHRHRHRQHSQHSSSKHPRHQAAGGFVTAAAAGFSYVPQQGVLFQAYESGGVYFQTVQLQNVGTVMKQLRLLPPQSCYFQISFPRFPLESSALAPGMCAEVDVCFMPDSLGDYEDTFTVDTPAGKFEVQLTGRRPHPELTLPPVLEVGSVLVGNTRTRTFEFVNRGGEGRFLLLTAQQWAATLQQRGHLLGSPPTTQPYSCAGGTAEAAAGHVVDSADASLCCSPVLAAETEGDDTTFTAAIQAASAGSTWEASSASASVSAGPFRISPAYLDLPAGAAAQIAVEFSPQQQGLQAQELVLVCDDCTAHPLRVEACGAEVQVELVGLDDRQWLPQDEQMPLWFGEVCPGACSTRQLRVFNATDLPFPFHWSVTSSQPQSDSSPASSTAHSTVSPFTVTPAAGVLQAQAEVSFSVEFAPQFTAPHSGALKLCVQRSGDAGLLSISQWGMDGTAIIDLSSTAASANGLATLAKASAVRTTAAGGSSSSQRLIGEDAAGADNAGAGDDVSSPCDPDSSAAAAEEEAEPGERQQASAWPGNSDLQVVADIAVEGVGCAISLTVEPAAALRVPGTLTVGQETSLPLQLHNDTAAPACFTIAEAGPAPEQHTVNGRGPSADVVVLPSQGVVPPHSVLDLAMHFTALRAGSHQQGFVLEVLHGRRQHLQADVAVQQVKVVPSYPSLDFGVLCVGTSATRTLQLLNTAQHSSSYWCIQQHGNQACVPSTVVTCQPSQGTLAPMACCTAAVTLTGSSEGTHKLLLRVSSNSDGCSSCHNSSRTSAAGAAAADKAGCSSRSCCCNHEYVQVLVTMSSPKVVLSRYRLPIQHAFTGVPQHHRLSMTNTSALPLTFSWAVQQLPHEQYIRLQNQLQQQQQPAGPAGHITLPAASSTVTEQQPQEDGHEPYMQQQALSSSRSVAGSGAARSTLQSEHSAGQIALSISPSTGQLGPGQSLQLQLELEPLAVGPVALLCCCQVAAMSRLVGFVLTADVGGLQVQYEVLRPEALLSQVQAARSKPRHSKHGSSRSSSPGGRLRSSIPSRDSSAPSGTAAASQVQQRVRYNSAARDGAEKSTAGPHDSASGRIFSANALKSSAKVAAEVLLADFGTVALHQPAELVLQVTNLTSIPTELRVWVAQFPAQNQGATSQMAAASCDQPAAGIDRSPASSAVPKAAAATGFCHSPVWSAASLQLSSKGRAGRASSPGSGGPSVHTRLSSPQHKGRPGSPEHLLSAASVAWKLTRTDPATHFGCRVGSSSSIAAEALISTVNSIPQLAQMQASSTQSDGNSGSNGSSVSAALKGPFRAFAGNAMMAARQAAAAAAAALGSGSAGCAVHLLPDACQLPGWGRSVLRLQAFNNLPGTYVDTLSVQVGDLPPQQIPIILRVEGSPLALSNHRAQRAASEVLHTLLHYQHQQLLLPHRSQAAQHPPTTQQTEGAHNGSCVEGDGGSGSNSGSGGCRTSSGEAGGISVSPAAAGSGAVCRVDLGVVPAGLQVQRALYLCNTGPLPMHITWEWPVQEGTSCPNNPSSTCSQDAVSHSSETVAGPEAAASVAAARLGLCDQEGSQESGGDRGSLTDSRPASAAVPGQPGQEASRPTSTGSISSNPDKGPAGKSTTSAGPGKKAAAAAAPGGKAAAAVGASGGPKAAAGKAGAATNERRASGVSAAAAGSTKTAAGRAAAEQDPSTESEEHQLEQETAPSPALEGPSCDPKPTTVPAGDVDQSFGTHDTDVSGSSGGLPQSCDMFDADLPFGGPSSLLQLLQKSCTALEATAEHASTAGDACGSSARPPAATDSSQHSSRDSNAARTLFKVVPEACVLPAGQQQQFMVSFCSWEATSAHQVVLSGRQAFCWEGEAAGPHLGGVVLQSYSNLHLKLHLLPQAGSSSNQAQQTLAATSGPIQCCITGGFHPHAAPPPRPLPALTLQLSARAAAPHLTLTDPDSFSFTYSRARDLSSQPGLQQTATMHNSIGCPQVFSLAVQGPFELVAATPSVPQDPDAFRGLLGCDSWLQSHKGSKPQATMMGGMQHVSLQIQEPGLMLLPPGESVDVTVRFRPPPVCSIPLEQNPSATAAAGRASEAGSAVARLTHGGSSSRVPGFTRTGSMVARAAPMTAALPGTGRSSAPAAGGVGQLECQGLEAVVALRRSEADAAACSSSSNLDASTMPLIEQHLGLLTVHFATSQQQSVPLAARVLQPALMMPTKLDFGEVHMAAPRTLELLLTNPTQTDAAYKAVIQPMEVTSNMTASEQLLRLAAVAAYSVVPASGMVPGRGIQMPRQTRLHVTFAPQRSGPASACLQLSVQGGDQVLVVLQGVGVHAERAEPRAAFDL